MVMKRPKNLVNIGSSLLTRHLIGNTYIQTFTLTWLPSLMFAYVCFLMDSSTPSPPLNYRDCSVVNIAFHFCHFSKLLFLPWILFDLSSPIRFQKTFNNFSSAQITKNNISHVTEFVTFFNTENCFRPI